MIDCHECGHPNDDGATFCRRCDAYLEWDGERVPTAPSTQQRPGSDPKRSRAAPPAFAHLAEATEVAKVSGRPDLEAQLVQRHARALDEDIWAVVLGEFKKGKSTLVNALVNAPVCPVDADVVTSVPTIVRFGDLPTAVARYDAEDGAVARAQPISLEEVEALVGSDASTAPRPSAVEVFLNRTMLRSGLTLVDTPGVGGLNSFEGRLTLGTLRLAHAALFVTDASQELTEPELEFLRLAQQRCPTLLVITKIDLYPEWRRIATLDMQHLAHANLNVGVVAISSFLRLRAATENNLALHDESGYAKVVDFLRQAIQNGRSVIAESIARDVGFAVEQVKLEKEAELQVLAAPHSAPQVVEQLVATQKRAASMTAPAADWQQLLTDGTQDLAADVEHDLRERFRRIGRTAETIIEERDRKDDWDEVVGWLRQQVSREVVECYEYLSRRAEELAVTVASRIDTGFELDGPLRLEAPLRALDALELGTQPKGKKKRGARFAVGLSAARGSYGGIAMLAMFASVAGVALAPPVALALGVGLGGKALKDERTRQVALRKQESRASVRSYLDEVAFRVNKDFRDALRSTQRWLRDQFTARAKSLQTPSTRALEAVNRATDLEEQEKKGRIEAINADVERLDRIRRDAADPQPSARSRSSTAMTQNLVDQARVLMREAREAAPTSELQRTLEVSLARIDEPLRIAIAGKVKAGKSTLLNALVGDEIAPTDAGECTRIVTWYRDGRQYRVVLHQRSGPPSNRRFHREHGALQIELDGVDVASIDHLEVEWPSERLREHTLIDTPGLASLTTDLDACAQQLATAHAEHPREADAVIYLLRHLHATDIGFLGAFNQDAFSGDTPVSAIGVLSRADEIGSCRLDALDVAARVARRYAGDARVRRLCATVVPVAGLLAQSGSTMRDDEFRALAQLASAPVSEVVELLLTVDRFASRPSDSVQPEPIRRGLLERFGLFGVRLSERLLRQGLVRDAGALGDELVRRSGLEELRVALVARFGSRARVLKARSALHALETALLTPEWPHAAQWLARVEALTASAHALTEIRVLNQLYAGELRPRASTAEEMERLLGGSGDDARLRLGVDPNADGEALRTEAHGALRRWRRIAENPAYDPNLRGAAREVVRSCEGLLEQMAVPAAGGRVSG